jgi:outer membrane protein assembly factor BamA
VLRLTSGLVGDFAVVTSVKMRHARIVSRSNAKRDDGLVIGSTLFDEQKPVGAGGGWANSLTLGIVFDQRDFAPWPRRGVLAEVIYDGYPAGLSDHVFGRASAGISGYLPVGKNWVVAGHLAASELFGDAPFWEYARLGGNDRNRGFADRRFVDQSALYFNLEGRWRVFGWRLKREQFHLSLVPFVDGGQVAPSLISPFLWSPWHFSTGLEVILTWNLATHLNITGGFSSEGFAFALDTRVMF